MFSMEKSFRENGTITKEYFKEYLTLKQALKRFKGINLKSNPVLDTAFKHINNGIKQYRSKLKVQSTVIDYIIKYKNKGFKTEYKFAYNLATIEQIKSMKLDPVSLKKQLYDNSVLAYFKTGREQCLISFRAHRKAARQPRIRTRSTQFRNGDRQYDLKTIGYTHYELGTIFNIYTLRQSRIIWEPKKPRDEQNYMAVELEFYIPTDENTVAAELTKRGLGKYIHLHHDGSIRAESGHTPLEISILATEQELDRVIKSTCEVLNKLKAKVNSSCGMHVHVDMRHRDRDIVFNNLVSTQPILYAMNPKTRLVSRFCKKNKYKDIKNSVDRYSGINAEALKKHGTIEIRIHSGTVNDIKILNWTKLIRNIVSKNEKIKRGPRTFRTFVKNFDIDLELASYIADRIEKFNLEENDNEGAAA